MYTYFFHYSEEYIKKYNVDCFLRKVIKITPIDPWFKNNWVKLGHTAVYEHNSATNTLRMLYPEDKEISISKLAWLTLSSTTV